MSQTHILKKRPTRSHLKRNSFSFSIAEVNNICFNDNVEIEVYDGSTLVGTHPLTGFVFMNSLVKKKADNGDEYFVLKI